MTNRYEKYKITASVVYDAELAMMCLECGEDNPDISVERGVIGSLIPLEFDITLDKLISAADKHNEDKHKEL